MWTFVNNVFYVIHKSTNANKKKTRWTRKNGSRAKYRTNFDVEFRMLGVDILFYEKNPFIFDKYINDNKRSLFFFIFIIFMGISRFVFLYHDNIISQQNPLTVCRTFFFLFIFLNDTKQRVYRSNLKAQLLKA